MVGCMFAMSYGDEAAPGRTERWKPSKVIQWDWRKTGLLQWGCGGKYICGVSGEPDTLDVWVWDKGIVRKGKQYQVSGVCEPVVMADARFLHGSPVKEPGAIIVRSIETGKVVHKWALGEDWYCRMARSSTNGKYACVTVAEKYSDVDHPRLRTAVVPQGAPAIRWGPTLVGSSMFDFLNLRMIVPSDDGAYLAVGGWNNGVAIIDLVKNKVLWKARPDKAISPNYVAFSPDSKVIYAGGGLGCVYGMDVKTGKVLTRWFSTPTGKSVYGHRISAVAVSPDGRFVAAGTGPSGLVYLWWAKTGKRAAVLNHGLTTILILSFSPDSDALATVAGGLIKVWKMPAEGGPKATERKGQQNGMDAASQPSGAGLGSK